MALEEYIKQVKEIWTSYTLDLVNYQNKCRLIRYVPRITWEIHFDPLCLVDGTTSSQSVARI